MPKLTRRKTLLGLSSAITLGGASLAVAAAPTEQRFVVVILRGALDGLAAVVPYSDPGLMALRPQLVPPAPGQANGLLDLGGAFGLHPAMPLAHAMYKANQLLILHAVAGNYRVRSHFEAQDYLESGADHRMSSGWLNRVAGAIPGPSSGRAAAAPGGTIQVLGGQDLRLPNALAVGPSVPLLLRGPSPIGNWAPHGFGEAAPGLYQQILALHAADPVTGPAIAAGMRARGFGDEVMAGTPKEAGFRLAFPALARAAGAMLRAPGGPRLAALEIGGWDTHTAQMNRLNQPLGQLDQGLDVLRTELGGEWGRTVVLVMTEFGRTARMNGTNGTDHGTGSVAFLAGGAVSGGRVVANWPGLSQGQLFENRDLAPTTDLRAAAKGVLAGHLGLTPAALAQVFPSSEAAAAMRGLVRGG